jgi:hypothetical protein
MEHKKSAGMMSGGISSSVILCGANFLHILLFPKSSWRM